MANLKASIDFGLVHIPVEIVTAEDRQEQVSFHLLDSRDESRIRQKRVNEETGKEVEWEDIVKGYEVEKGKYVVFTEDELKALEAESNRSLAIDKVVDRDEIPLAMFETPYVVKPAPGGERGYAILQKVLERTERFAVIQAVLRTKEHLGVLYSDSGAILLGILRYPSELKEASEMLDLKPIKISEREVSMAEKLIEQMHDSFDPKDYKDHYAEKLRQAIKAKTGRKRAKLPSRKGKATPSRSVDIARLLEESIKKSARRAPRRRKAA